MKKTFLTCFNWLEQQCGITAPEAKPYPFAEGLLFSMALAFTVIFLPLLAGVGNVYAAKTLCLQGVILAAFGFCFFRLLLKNGCKLFSRQTLLTLFLSGAAVGALLFYEKIFVLEGQLRYYCYFNGMEYIDNMYHSAVGESVVSHGYPSINHTDPAFLRYHTGVNYCFGFLSKLTGIPVHVLLCFVYPLLAAPLLCFISLKLVREIKLFTGRNGDLNLFDLFLVPTLLLGTFYAAYSYPMGLAIPSILISHSMAAGFIVLFLSMIFVLRMIRKGMFERQWFRSLFFVLLLPLILFFCTLAKISCGCAVAGATCIWLFTKGKYSRFFWKEICYAGLTCVLFLLILKGFVMGGNGYGNQAHQWALLQWFKRPERMWGFVITFLPVLLVLHETKWSFREIFSGKHFWGNTLLALTAVLWLPGLLWDIYGGSSFYFFIVPYCIAILICCGFAIPEKLLRSDLCKCIILFIIVFGGMRGLMHYASQLRFSIKSRAAARQVTASPFYRAMNKAREFTRQHPQETLCFMDETAPLTFKRNAKGTTVLVQAYLGVPVLNAFYFEDGKLFSYLHHNDPAKRIRYIPKRSGVYSYGLDAYENAGIRKISHNEALHQAKERGYRYLISFHNATVELTDLSTCAVTDLMQE